MSMKENGTGQTEQRLIDANELENHRFPTQESLYDSGWNDAIDAIMENSPTVDAVEVVRCKACQHWQKRHETRGICLNHNAIVTFTTPDFYCACGERKQNDKSS